MAVISVTGTGKICRAPDAAEISVRLESFGREYGECCELCAAKEADLKKAVLAVGASEKDLKTASYNVAAKYESVQEKGAYKSVFTGFACTHVLKLIVALEGDKLKKTLEAVLLSSAEAGLTLRFTVSDRGGAVNSMLGNAYADAYAKACALAAAGGFKLGALKSVKEGELPGGLWSRSEAAMPVMKVKAAAFSAPDVTPEDVEESVTVYAEWEVV